MRWLLFIVIAAMGMFKGHSQALVQTYTDRCTGQTMVYTVQMNGSTVVAYYNRSRVFTAAEFSNGTLQGWLEETYAWWQALSPCSTNNATNNTTQQTTQNATTNATNAANNATSNATNNATSGTTQTTTTGTTGTTNTGSTNTGTTNTNTSSNGNTGSTSTGSTSSGSSSGNGSSSSSSGSSSGSSSSGSSGSGNESGGSGSGSNNSSGGDSGGTSNDNSGGDNSGNDSGGDTSGDSGSGGSEDNSGDNSSDNNDNSSSDDNSSGDGDSGDGDSSGESESDSSEEGSESNENSESEEGEGEGSDESSEESSEEESESEEVEEDEQTEEESDESSEEESEEESDEEESSDEESEDEDEDEEQEESTNEDEEEEDEEERERKLAPPIVTANLVTMQMIDGVLTNAASFGFSQSSLTGEDTYAANAMIWSNLKQYSLNLSKSHVFFNYDRPIENMVLDEDTGKYYNFGTTYGRGSVMKVQSLSAGYMRMFSTHIATAGISDVYMGQKENAWKGFVGGWAITGMSIFLQDSKPILTAALTVFGTKPFNFKKWDRLTISPMLAYSMTPITFDINLMYPTGNYHGTWIAGSNFDFNLTQRFKANIGGTLIGNTGPGVPLSWAITVGSRFQF